MDRDALNPNAVLQRKIQTNLSESASRCSSSQEPQRTASPWGNRFRGLLYNNLKEILRAELQNGERGCYNNQARLRR